MASHLEQRLETDLNIIRDKVLQQSQKVQTGINDAIHALQTGNQKLAYATILNDQPINRTMREIDRLCHKFIAVHLPSGTHLRLLSSIIRMNIELERIGDYAVTIARESIQLSSPPDGTMGREINRLASETILMLKQAIKSFADMNDELARSTIIMTRTMEYNLDSVYQEITGETELKNAKDTLATFVIFTHLKRVADQAKNLCEDTIFAVTGQQKKPKVYNILFIDEDNSCLSQLAQAVAQKNHPDICKFRSAGRTAATAIDPELINFLESRGDNTSQLSSTTLSELSHQDIAEQHVIISLQGDVSQYLDSIPFHTSVLEWDINSESDAQAIDVLYRTLALTIKDLVELLHGNEA